MLIYINNYFGRHAKGYRSMHLSRINEKKKLNKHQDDKRTEQVRIYPEGRAKLHIIVQ